MRARLVPLVLALVVPALVAGCATTSHDRGGEATPTWRAAAAADAAPGPLAGGGTVTAHVVAFGLAPSVADRWPALASARTGFGVAQRIADALWDSGRFVFREEKPEITARLAALLERRASGAEGAADLPEAPPEVPWLLYGEVVEVRVGRDESVRGLAGRTTTTTEVTVQLRLVDRATSRVWPATASGVHALERRPDGEIDPIAVAEATGEAVRAAAAELVARLEGGG